MEKHGHWFVSLAMMAVLAWHQQFFI